ncbi:MAG: hypothetical protein IT376_17565 [Polyangiaceae bacterium]|nr:hypothetical protein [Polyangiaceae bacterium]
MIPPRGSPLRATVPGAAARAAGALTAGALAAGALTAGVLTAGALTAGVLTACSSRDAAARAEVERVSRAVELVREASNDDKPAALAALEQTPAATPDAVQLKQRCLAAYRRYTSAIGALAVVRRAVAPDAGVGDAGATAAALVTGAELELRAVAPDVARCSALEGELRRKHAAR